ncbi:MAG: hypothetical protein AAGH19_05200 [Pseudomonadota bacterium]
MRQHLALSVAARRLAALGACTLLTLAVAAQESPAKDPENDPENDLATSDPIKADAGEDEAVTVAQESIAGTPDDEGSAEALAENVATEEPNPEVLAEAAAAAGGELGEVDEEFTPTDEISEDYPVPLPADI